MMRGAIVALVVGLYGPALAEECDWRKMDTATRTECERQKGDVEHAKMLKSFDYALSGAKALTASGSADFEPDIRETQRAWQAWMEVQCRLEGVIIYGSATGIVEAGCVQRLSRERAKALEEIADQLNGLAQPANSK
jgi:uncharacterized protein YecT (DUF1311 family)